MAHVKSKLPLRAVYNALIEAWGPQHWWPARTRFEMMAGAILTQNTAWTNVEKAVRNLRAARVLSPGAIDRMSTTRLAGLIRPAGYFNVKARRLKNLARWLMDTCGGHFHRMAREDTHALRRKLLSVNGIGKETADSILLYAFQRPVFVVDAYTRRILLRHRWLRGRESYDEVASLFVDNLDDVPATRAVETFNEYHALMVALAKRHCRARPDCRQCPLKPWLP